MYASIVDRLWALSPVRNLHGSPEDDPVAEVRAAIAASRPPDPEFLLDWASACPAYPTLHWPVTVFLGQHLGIRLRGGRPPDETEFLALCGLPSFRRGWMDDSMRLALLRQLPAPTVAAVREG